MIGDWYYFAFPAHVNYFSATAMHSTLSRLGFVDIDIATTTDQFQMLYCWEAAIKLGYIDVSPAFYEGLRDKGQHENLCVFAVK